MLSYTLILTWHATWRKLDSGKLLKQKKTINVLSDLLSDGSLSTSDCSREKHTLHHLRLIFDLSHLQIISLQIRRLRYVKKSKGRSHERVIKMRVSDTWEKEEVRQGSERKREGIQFTHCINRQQVSCIQNTNRWCILDITLGSQPNPRSKLPVTIPK